MKKIPINPSGFVMIAISVLMLSACTKSFLDQQPQSSISPENYLNDESHLSAYSINLYSLFQTPGFQQTSITDFDNATDNQANIYNNNTLYAPGQYKVGQDGGVWDFTDIYKCNYFFVNVLSKWTAGKITGNQDNIKHYIGEVYFLRAYVYFKRLMAVGDFPIVKTTLPDNKEILTAASKRSPRNEVARFILSDLDSATLLMKEISPDGRKNRLSRICSRLFSSRVALFEATWLKHFKGTAFVPKGPEWPGAGKDYNANYSFPSGSIEGEIDFFLGEAIKNAKIAADAITLTTNTGHLQQDAAEAINPYYDMFAQTDMSKYNEVLLWRQYDLAYGNTAVNGNNEILQGSRVGITRGMVDCFLMKNGLPIYSAGSGYQGDDSTHAVRIGRDDRLMLFLKEQGQKNVLYFSGQATSAVPVQPVSPIINYGNITRGSVTGYDIRKGLNFDDATCINNRNTTGTMVFRGVEALLNYIEACYEKNGNLDATAASYWQTIRTRAGVDPDFNKTIAATEMSKEASNDWGAYSGGSLVDPTLYNIRRERRCELMAEGLRFMDLIRWRAMDQMTATPYHIEGFKLWGGSINKWYPQDRLIYNAGTNSTVSSPSTSLYLRPFEITGAEIVNQGFRWAMAHYLSPIAIQHLQVSSKNGDISSSPIYQNPYWPTVAGQGATR